MLRNHARTLGTKLSVGAVSMFALAALLPVGRSGAVAQAPAPAPSRVLAVGQTISSSLDSSDPSDPQDEYKYEDYRLDAPAGTVLQIDMESDQIDSHVEVRRVGNGEIVAYNDDREPGSSLNSRVLFSPQAGETYVVRAREHFGGASGAYTIAVRRLESASRPARPLAPNFGALRIDDRAPLMVEEAPGSRAFRYEEFTVEGASGERIRVDMISGDFDSRLELRSRDGQLIAADDNSGSNQNARLQAIFPSAGEYRLRAMAPLGQSGAYQLSFAKTPQVVERPPIEIAVGQTMTGELGISSPIQTETENPGNIDFFYDLYSLNVRQGHPVTILLDRKSDDLDPVLEVGSPSPLGFAQFAYSDDSRSSLNSMLVLRPVADGIVLIRARSLSARGGPYELRVIDGAMTEEAAAALQ